jgi:chromosome segregation ATPase
MPDETNSSPQPPELSEADLAELTRGIDREYIVGLVKQDKHLQRRVFAGFRPTHLPWDRVPARLAQDAVGEPGKSARLINLWRVSNQDLLDEVSNMHPEDLREGVITLLVRRGLEDREQILWALRLDERLEVEQALADGLEKELLEEASGLISQAENTILTGALEAVRGQLAEAEARREVAETEVERLQRLAQRRADDMQDLRKSRDEAKKEQAWLKEEINTLKKQRQSDQETIAELMREFAEKQERVQELRRSVRDLKSSLQAQAQDRDLDEALLELEEERQNSARLRLKVQSLTNDLREAYEKRDRVREQVESQEQDIERLKHDKEVIIEEKRRLQECVQDLRAEVKDLQMQYNGHDHEQILRAMSIENFESAWQHAREDVRNHIHSVLSTLRAKPQTQLGIDKKELWRDWLERELALVEEGLAALDTYPETGGWFDTAVFNQAQELLALRWYLLEYTKQAIQRVEMTSFSV